MSETKFSYELEDGWEERAERLAIHRQYSGRWQAICEQASQLSESISDELRSLQGDSRSRILQAVNVLIAATDRDDKRTCCAAVQILGGLHCNDLPREFGSKVVDTLLKATSASHTDLRPHAIESLKAYATAFPVRIVEGVSDNSLFSSSDDDILNALELIITCGQDAASAASREGGQLLKHHSSRVVVKACRFLRFLGADAQQTVPDLIQLVSNNCTPEVQSEALVTLAALDPTGTRLVEIKSSNARQLVIRFLRRRGERKRELRQCLEKAWRSPEAEIKQFGAPGEQSIPGSTNGLGAGAQMIEEPAETRPIRPGYNRDHYWLSLYVAIGTPTYHSYVKIRDHWNALSASRRMEIAPNLCGTIGIDPSGTRVVKQGIKQATRERDGKKSPVDRRTRRKKA